MKQIAASSTKTFLFIFCLISLILSSTSAWAMKRELDYKAMGEAFKSAQGITEEKAEDESITEDLPPPEFELLFNEGKLKAFITYTELPYVLAEAQMLIYFTDTKTGEPVDVGSLPYVSIFMAGEGLNQGSLETKTEKLKDQNGKIIKGAYKVRNLYFLTGGPWEVQVVLDSSFLWWGQVDRQYYTIEFDPTIGACISHP